MATDEAPHHRGQLDELDAATCRRLLASAEVARVVHVVEGDPHISVVTIGMDGDDVVVRSVQGTRLTTALSQSGAPVLVQADHLDPAARSGWSVVARGHMVPVLDQVEVARLDRTMPPSWVLGDSGGTWLRLTLESLTGRRVGGAVDGASPDPA